jgi:transposase
MYTILTRLERRRTLAASIVLRVRIILLAFQRKQNVRIAELLNVGRHCVGRWRRRWQESFDALLSIELTEPRAVLERAIVDTLRDAHRSGSPGKFSGEQIAQLIAIACEDPRESGRPVEEWTGAELADEMQKRSVVDSLSASWVNELLRQAALQPHRRKYWCFTTEKDREAFQTQVKEVCQTYLRARSAFLHDGTRTICVDEMTGLQANQRRAETKLARPGQIAKSECQYTRHGTLSLTGSWDVVQGQMVHTTIEPTRNNDDFAQHIAQTISTAPNARWIFVMDNLNTHSGEPVVRLVSRLLGIDQESLGDKRRRRGILGSARSRREFLSDPHHRIRFVFIPKHSSWLNQIEVVFGIVGRRIMRHGSFTSQADLREKLRTFIDYFNRTFAKPFNWTYTGKPTSSKANRRPRTWRENTQSKKFKQILALVA